MEGPIRRIMVYIDGSEQSVTAAQYAIVLSRALSAELFSLYVINTRALNDLVKARIFLQAEQEEYHIRELARQKGLAIETIKTSGTVHTEIKKQVLEHSIDLLVLGELSHIRSRRDEFYPLFNGS